MSPLRTHDSDENPGLCVLDLLIVLSSYTLSSSSSSARCSTGELEQLTPLHANNNIIIII